MTSSSADVLDVPAIWRRLCVVHQFGRAGVRTGEGLVTHEWRGRRSHGIGTRSWGICRAVVLDDDGTRIRSFRTPDEWVEHWSHG